MVTLAGMYLQRRVNATPGPFRSAARSGVLPDRVVRFPPVNGCAERPVFGNRINSNDGRAKVPVGWGGLTCRSTGRPGTWLLPRERLWPGAG